MTVVLPPIPFSECLREAWVALNALYADDARTIILGAHSEACGDPPPDAIIFNTEWPGVFSPRYRARLSRAAAVWDHSRSNMAGYDARVKVHCPLRYCRELETIPARPKEIDIGFYGSLNERRRAILGSHVENIPYTFGKDRDEWIARVKVIVVPHYYGDNGVEQTRICHLLANGIAVVAELAPDQDDVPGPVYVEPMRIVDTARELVKTGEWFQLGRSGRDAFKAGGGR